MTTTVLGLTAAATGAVLAAAPMAFGGGVGGALSPAFGTFCANHYGTQATGTTTHGTGAANGNLAGLPIGSPLNHCGGADIDPRSGLDIAALNIQRGRGCLRCGLVPVRRSSLGSSDLITAHSSSSTSHGLDRATWHPRTIGSEVIQPPRRSFC